ncbi:hypothetical protein HYPP_02626 [Hyphomicrobium sp. ghe19]|nr:hypothetical protein HYPP_02626 [Hyphomicrobium sp. ghe19]
MGFLNILTLIFVTLKLLAVGVVATWSWWLVFAPTLLSIGVSILVLFVVLIIAWWAD